jgi:hypothetical protein
MEGGSPCTFFVSPCVLHDRPLYVMLFASPLEEEEQLLSRAINR